MRPSLLLCLGLSSIACSEEVPPPMVTGKLQALPVTINLPEGPIGAVTSTTVTLKNDGTGALTINAIATTGPFSADGAAITIPAFGSSALKITFTVPSAGEQSGQLTITHDGSNGPSDVSALRGKGLAPQECYPCSDGPDPACLATGSSVEYLRGAACGTGDQCTFTSQTTTCNDGCNPITGRCAIPANACGSPLSPTPVAPVAAAIRRPAIGWSGSEYGVLWSEYEAADRRFVRFQRLSKGGERLGATLELTPNGSGGEEIAMVATPIGYGLVFPNITTGEQGMSFALVSLDGELIAGPTGLGTDTRYLRAPSMAYNPTARELAVVVSAQPRMPGLPGQIRFYRFDEAGARIGQFQTISDPQTDANYPHIAFSSGEYGVAFERINTSPLPGGVVWVGVNPNGLKQGPETDVVDSPGGVNHLNGCSAVVAKGDRFGMLYSDRSTGFLNLFFVEVDTNAQVSRGPLQVSQVTEVGGIAWQQSLTATPTGYTAAWIQFTAGIPSAFTTTIGTDVATPTSLGSANALAVSANGCDVGLARSIEAVEGSAILLGAIP